MTNQHEPGHPTEPASENAPNQRTPQRRPRGEQDQENGGSGQSGSQSGRKTDEARNDLDDTPQGTSKEENENGQPSAQ